MFGNVRSIRNKVDELVAACRYNFKLQNYKSVRLEVAVGENLLDS